MSSGKSFKTAPNSAGILCPEIKKMAIEETVILEYFEGSITELNLLQDFKDLDFIFSST